MELRLREAVDAFKKAVHQSRTVVIVPHVNPDGDAIGSSLALAFALQKTGKEVTLACADDVPQNLRFLPGWQQFKNARELFPDDKPTAVPENLWSFDLAIIVDLSVPKRLAHARHLLLNAKRIAAVDHHELGEDLAEGILVVDSSYSATAMLLYDHWRNIGFEFDADIAQCLLTGIVTDTGGFKHQNTDPQSLRAAADLMELGGDLAVIHQEVWDRKPYRAIKLLAFALGNIRLGALGKCLYSHLGLQEYENAEATDEDTEGIVNEIGRVDSAVVFALFREHKPNRVRVSVRSHGDIDVSEICRRFGGGGHKNAAGCTFDTGINEAMQQLVPALEEAALKG